MNADHIGLYHIQVWGTIFVAAAAVAISWNGLSAAAAFLLLPPHLAWLLPAALDVTIVVFTLATLSLRSRGEGVALLLLGIYGLTAISAATNALHVLLESPADSPPLQVAIGTSLAALAPILILLMSEVLGTIITKPSQRERRAQALREEAELNRLAAAAEKAKKPARTPRKTASKTNTKGVAK